MKFAASLSKLFARKRQPETAACSTHAAKPAPLIIALEPRIVYDGSAASIGAAAAAQHHAGADAHGPSGSATPAAAQGEVAPGEASAGAAHASELTAPRHAVQGDAPTAAATGERVSGATTSATVHGLTEAVVSAPEKQVVFIDSNVSDYQTLIAGLPSGTQYVMLDSTKDGLAQIAQYLEQHPGVSAIHLVSHGSDGEIQVGSTWLNEGDLSAWSAELAQIGAAMKPGGDFLIYGCDVAGNADGQTLVQQIASISGLNVAASTDATGAAALGGDWTLEYDAGAVHTPVIFSQAAEQQYGALLGVTNETFDSQVGFVTTGGASGVTSFTLDGITYTLDQAAEFAVDSTTVNQFGAPPLSTSPSDGVLFGNVQGTSLTSMTMTLQNGDKMAVQSFDIDINAPSVVAVEALDASGNVITTLTLNTSLNNGSSVFHEDLSNNAAFSGIKSLRFVETDGAFLTPTLNNFSYVDLSSPPALTASGGTTSFVEGDNVASTPVAIDSGVALTDGDATTAKQGTVSITGNFSAGQDVLGFTNTSAALYGDISSAYNATTGVMTLTSTSGTATIAQWQSAFRAVTYTDTSLTPSTATRTVSFALTSDAYMSSSNTVTKNVTVTATDQTPIVSTTGGTTIYRSGSVATTIDSGVSVSDLDNTSQASGTVSIGAGFHIGDTLSFSNANSTTFGNITGSYNAATGVLTLTSTGATATDAQWAHALSAVAFSSTSTSYGNRTISFATSDGTKMSVAATDIVDVTNPLLVTTDSGSASFVAGDNTASTPVAVDSGLTVSDTLVTTLSSATVAITGNFHAGEDVLSFTNDGATMGNIVGSYNAVTGVFTLSSSAASATLAQWQSALQSVTYTDTAITPNSTRRTISFTAVDGSGNTSATATRTVTVTDTDQTPIVTTTGGTTNYVGASSPVTIDSGITLSDLDNSTQSSGTVAITGGFHNGDTLSFTNTSSALFGNIAASYNSATGVLTLTSSGAVATVAQWAKALDSVTFASTSTTYGNRTISFATSDGTKTSVAATDTIAMTAPPVITTDSGSAAFVAGDNVASTPVTIDSGLTVTDGSAITLGTATVAITGNFHAGEDVLSFTNDGATMGNIVGSYNAVTGVLTLTSSAASATLAQWQSALQSVTYTDTAVTPNNTTRTISFTAVDSGAFTSNTATRTVTVTDTDQTPIVSATGGTTNYVAGTSAVAIDGAITVTDRDNFTQSFGTVAITGGFHSGDTLAFTNTSSALFGNIVASYNGATGVLTMTSSGASATDVQWSNALSAVAFSAGSTAVPGARTISFAVNDGIKTSAATTGTVDVLGPPTITVDPGSAAFVAGDNVASTPVAIDSGLNVTDGASTTLASATVAITGNFHAGEDVLSFTNDGATMGNIAASYNAATGVLTLVSSGASATVVQWQSALDSVTYTDTAVAPNSATRTVSFTVVDGANVTSNTATRTVTVTDTDQTPVVTTAGTTIRYAGGTSATLVDGAITVADRDNTTQAAATASITAGFHIGDTLSFTNTSSSQFGNIVATYDSATGVLTMTSVGATATDTQWSNALSAVTFSASAAAPPGNRTISFAVSDGIKNSAVATDTVELTAPPTLITDAGSASFVAADNAASAPVAIDPGLSIADGSATTLASATVALTGNFHSGEDVLGFTNDGATMGNISASYNAGTGVLTLNSAGASATLAQWQAALRSVTYTDTAITPDNAMRTVSFTATDGAGIASNTATRTVSVADTDQTPIVTTTGGATNYVAGSQATVVNPHVSVTDRDNATQSSATVSIAGNFHSGEDTLAFANTSAASYGNISVSYDAATGVLTLSSAGGTATDAQWANALSAVTFASSGTHFDNRTISFATNDGAKTSTAADATVTVLDRPHVVTDAGPASFVAGDNAPSTPVVVSPGLTLNDASSTTLAAATVAITGGFHGGEDVLAFTNDGATMGDIAASYDAGSGVLTLRSASGGATLAQWRAALASITYVDTAVRPDATTRVISFAVTDGNGTPSGVQTRSVTVADTDQTPLLSVGGSVTFVSSEVGATPVAVAPEVTLSDRDPGATLISAQVTITTGFDAAHDSLAFTGSAATGSITASYDAGTGVLTLTASSGTASLAQWQAALQSVTYADSAHGASGSRTVTFSVSDGMKRSAPASNTVSIVAGPSGGSPTSSLPRQTGEGHMGAISSSTHAGGSDHTAPPYVLDEFDQPVRLGSVPVVPTITFSDPNTAYIPHSLDRTTVPRFDATALDAALALTPPPVDVPAPLPELSLAVRPDDPFSIDVATLLPPSAALHGADVTVRLADGRSLPGWIRYDAANGVLRGKLPPGTQDVHIVMRTRDAGGHETRREIVLAPPGQRGVHGAPHGLDHPKAPGHAARTSAEPVLARDGRPEGKPSLDLQFQRARAALHVTRPGAGVVDGTART